MQKHDIRLWRRWNSTLRLCGATLPTSSLRYASIGRSRLPYNRSLLTRKHTSSGMPMLVSLFCNLHRSFFTLTHISCLRVGGGLKVRVMLRESQKGPIYMTKRPICMDTKGLLRGGGGEGGVCKTQKRPIFATKEVD